MPLASSALVIRPTRPEDLESLTNIFNTVVDRGDALVYEAPLTISALQSYFAAFTSLFTAEIDGKVVGGYCLRPVQPGRGSHIANAVYTVDETRRGEGIGRKLGEHSIDTARDLGFLGMQFNAVVSTNDIAVMLWRDLGFDIVGTIPEAFRNGSGEYIDLFVMHRKL
jgi:L-amino acid N-acyltransferase YncA